MKKILISMLGCCVVCSGHAVDSSNFTFVKSGFWCKIDKRNGVNPTDGTCVQCAPGQIFNQNASDTGYCSEAVALTKTDLMYGRGKTNNSNPDVKNQCWTMTDAAAYRECVMNGGVIKKKKVIKQDVKAATATK